MSFSISAKTSESNVTELNVSKSKLTEPKYHYSGKTLLDVLQHLNQRDYKIIYSSEQIHRGMKVKNEPVLLNGSSLVKELLLPFNLTLKQGLNKRSIIVALPAIKNDFSLGITIFDELSKPMNNEVSLTLIKQNNESNKTNTAKLLRKVITTQTGLASYHNLNKGSYTLSISAIGYLTEIIKPILFTTTSDKKKNIKINLARLPIEKFVVSTSQFNIDYAQTSDKKFMSQDDLEQISHLASDVNRAVANIPGVAGGDVSARINIRGGTSHENVFLLDGMPLYDPFHMKEAGGLFGIVDSFTISHAQIITGGAPVEFGDHLSGVINVSSQDWQQETPWAVGINFLDLKVKGSGQFKDSENNWFFSARKGFLGAVSATSDVELDNYKPLYGDAFGKVNINLSDNTSLSWHSLITQDSHSCIEKCINGSDGTSISSYNWLTLKNKWLDNLSSSFLLGYGDLENNRNGYDAYDNNQGFSAIDDRLNWSFIVTKQSVQYKVSSNQIIKAGIEAKWQQAEYKYVVAYQKYNPFIALSQQEGTFERKSRLNIKGNTYGAYLSDLFKINQSFTAEVGLRWDKQTYTDEQQLSPRINLDYLTENGSNYKISWGIYQQAQGIHQLFIEDDENSFHSAQQVRQINFSYQAQLIKGYDYKVSLYHKKYDEPLPRYENIFGGETFIFESSVDRTLITPQEATTKGLEIVLQNSHNNKFNWWLGYSLSKAEEQINGHTVPRRWQQKHTANFSLSYQFSPSCNINLYGNYHTGWKNTSIAFNQLTPREDSNKPFLKFGKLYQNTFSDYFRVDFRVGCETHLNHGRLRYFFEAINVLNRDNTSGVADAAEFLTATKFRGSNADDGNYIPFIPSFGIIWQF
ncbi:MAG: TonB-dependent receptor [Colwellia sp.]|nr:TonB-dependent receptor [Colwellia sp.]